MSGVFDGAVAVITGATGGIGSACARMLARGGARVVLMGRSQPALARLAEEVGALDARACDLTETPAARRILRELPAPDILVNCAGGNRPKPFLELGDEDLAWSWQVNVVAALTAAQEVARRMVADGRGGAIVTVTSQMGHVGGRDRTAYCAAKHALEGASKAMAPGAPHRIRVNTVAPTFVETGMTRPFLADEEFRSAVVASIPLGRLGTAEEVASAVLFAVSPCAALMTGASLRIDGGWTAQ